MADQIPMMPLEPVDSVSMASAQKPAPGPQMSRIANETYAAPNPQDTAVDASGMSGVKARAYGVGNSLLAGLPEFVYRRISGGNEQKYQDFVNKYGKQFEQGNTAGMIGGAALGGIGEGVLGAGKAATAGASKLLPMIAKGALRGGTQGALYGVTGTNPGEELQGLATGGALGGVLGGIGAGVAGKAAKAASRAPAVLGEIADEADKTAVASLLGVNKRDIMKSMKNYPGGVYGHEAIEQAAKDTAQYARTLGATDKLSLKQAVEGEGEAWKVIAKRADDAGLNIASNPDAILNDPVIAKYMQEHGPQGMQDVQNILDKLDKGNFSENRKFLEKYRDLSYKQASSGAVPEIAMKAGELGDVAHQIRNIYDDAAWSLSPEFNQSAIKDAWKASRPLEYMLKREAAATQAVTAGSKTAASMLSNAAMSGMGGAAAGPAGAFIAPVIGDIVNKASANLANKAIGTAALGVRPLTERLMPAAEKLAGSKIPGMIQAGAPLASRLASALGTNAMRADNQPITPETMGAPGTPGSAPTGAIESDPVNMQMLEAGIQRGFNERTQGWYGPADESNQAYNEWKGGVLKAIKNNGQSPTINPKLAANVMFVNPEQRQAFIDSVTATKQLETSLPQTRGPLDISNLWHPEAQAAGGQIAESVGKAAGGGEDTKKAIKRILAGPGSKKAKFEKLTALIKSNPIIAESQKLGGSNGI